MLLTETLNSIVEIGLNLKTNSYSEVLNTSESKFYALFNGMNAHFVDVKEIFLAVKSLFLIYS